MASSSGCAPSSWTIPDEADNGRIHTPGALSMAKTSAANTGGSQFFVVPSDSEPSHLDGVHTVFGMVTEGLDVITEISELETEPGDKPVRSVTLVSVEITLCLAIYYNTQSILHIYKNIVYIYNLRIYK